MFALTLHYHGQVDFVVAFLGVTYARAVAAPLNPNYTAACPLPAHDLLAVHE